jgi:hypothetical protein
MVRMKTEIMYYVRDRDKDRDLDRDFGEGKDFDKDRYLGENIGVDKDLGEDRDCVHVSMFMSRSEHQDTRSLGWYR